MAVSEKQITDIQVEISEFQVDVILEFVYPWNCPLAFLFIQELTSFYNLPYCQVKQWRLTKWLHNAIENVLKNTQKTCQNMSRPLWLTLGAKSIGY